MTTIEMIKHRHRFCFWILTISAFVISGHPATTSGKTISSKIVIERNQFANVYKDNLNAVMDALDENYEPCEDFFQHACGNFDSNMIPSFLYNQQDRVKFFDIHRSEFKTGAGILMRNLYDSCKQRSMPEIFQKINMAANDNIRWNLILNEIQSVWPDVYNDELNDWPFLQYQWNERNYETSMVSWSKLAGHLAAHGISIFVNIFFAENTIFIGPADDIHVPCPSEDIIKESLMRSTKTINSQMAALIGSELSIFCRQLKGVLSADDEISDSNRNNSKTFSTSKLDDDVTEYFRTFFHSLNFTESEIANARKIQLDEQRLREIFTIIRSVNKRTLINYIIWRTNEALRYEDCYQLTKEFETLLLTEYWNWNVFEPLIKKDVAIATYLYHTTRYQKKRKDALVREHWSIAYHDPKIPKKEYNIEKAIKKYANTYLDESVIDTIYNQAYAQDKPTSFHSKLLRIRSIKIRQSFFEELIDDEEDVNHPRYMLREFLNFVQLIMQQPFYHYYSTQGIDLWMKSNILYSTDGYYTTIDCLEKQMEIIDNDEKWRKTLTYNEIEQIYKFSQAFGETYRDYQFWLNGESFSFAEEYILEYAKMTSKQIMFYAVAQTYCGRSQNNNSSNIYAKLINRSFMNMNEFQEAFECNPNASMNPAAKCYFRDC